MEEVAIRVSNVSKDFRLPDEKLTSVKSHIVHPFKHRTFDVQHALKGVGVEIKKGEFFGIVGRNGSGKSTLLKIIAGIYQPTKGSIEVAGKLVPFIELGVGFNPELTGRDNIYLSGALLGFSKKEIDIQYDDIVEFAELAPFMNQKLKNYSSGMQVRLAFSVAVRAKADILLVDEVLAVGDADFKRKCYNYFRTLKRDEKTVIFVSHDMDAVREYCDRAILIENGKIEAEGTANQIAADYTHLFTADESEEKIPIGTNRWGNRQLTVTHASAKYVESGHNPHLLIEIAAKAKADTDHPVIGFVIKSASGTPILGMNTKIKHHELGTIKKDQNVMTRWTIPDVFGDGNYSINVAVHAPGGTPTYDWWEDALSFKVTKGTRTPYLVEPDIKLEISN